MTIKEYQDKMDDLSIELGELQAKKDRIEASKLNDDEMKAALSAVDRKMAAIRSEKFRIEDEYNYQEEQKKEKFNKNRDDLIFKNELGSYSKRAKIKQEYIKKFPDSELTKDILLVDKEVREGKAPSKKIDINEMIKALEEARKAEIKAAEESEDDKEQSASVSNSDSGVSDDSQEQAESEDVNDQAEAKGEKHDETTNAQPVTDEELNGQAQQMMTDDGKGKQKTKGVHVAGERLKKILSSTAVRAGLVVGVTLGALALLVANPPLGFGALAVASGVAIKNEMDKGRKGR